MHHYILLLLFCFVGCQLPAPKIETTIVNLPASPINEISKELELTSHIYLKVSINDSITGVFLFDTGANELIIDQKFATENSLTFLSKEALQKKKEYSYGVGEGKLKNNYLEKVKIEIANRKFIREEVRTMALDSLFADVLGHEINGIVGYDLFKAYWCIMDFDSSQLSLNDTMPTALLKGYEKIPYQKEYRKPMVQVALELPNNKKIKSKLIFDMGSGRSISLTHQKALTENLFNTIDSLNCQGHEVTGIGGKGQSCEGEIKSINFGTSIQLDSINIELGRDQKGALGMHKMYDGLLGMEVIRQFNVIIDQKGKNIYLRKRARGN